MQEPQNFYPVMQVFGVEIPTRCFIGGLPYSVSQYYTHQLSPSKCANIASVSQFRDFCTILQMTELELNNFFSQFGAVRDTKIITDRNGVSKG